MNCRQYRNKRKTCENNCGSCELKWPKHILYELITDTIKSTISSTLTEHKVSDVVFQAKPRTKSFRCTGSVLATPLISSAIEGYWDPLHATTCKQAHMHNINSHSIHEGATAYGPLSLAVIQNSHT